MTWLSTFFSTTYCEEAAPSNPPEGSSASHNKDDAPGPVNEEKQEEATSNSGEHAEKEEGEEAPAEEEEEEPEDILPGLREDCKEGKACFQYNKHFEHCQEKVNAGHGFKGEDCVEELSSPTSALLATLSVHLMHCVDNCVAPKLFSKLK